MKTKTKSVKSASATSTKSRAARAKTVAKKSKAIMHRGCYYGMAMFSDALDADNRMRTAFNAVLNGAFPEEGSSTFSLQKAKLADKIQTVTIVCDNDDLIWINVTALRKKHVTKLNGEILKFDSFHFFEVNYSEKAKAEVWPTFIFNDIEVDGKPGFEEAEYALRLFEKDGRLAYFGVNENPAEYNW